MLDRQTVADTLTAALATGGDFAEIFAESTERNAVQLQNGIVENAQAGIDYGAGIRIFNGFNCVYAYTNDTSRGNLIKVARNAAAVIQKTAFVTPRPFTTLCFDNVSPVRVPLRGVHKKQIVDMLRRSSEASFAYDKRITQTVCAYGDVVQNVLVANSDGLWAEDVRTRTRVRVQATASSESEKQVGAESPGGGTGFEFYDNIDMAELGRTSAECALTMLLAKPCPSGKMPVIIDNGFGGVIFHEACGHALEATSIAKKSSVFADKMGQPIASPIVTARDDGMVPNAWGSIGFDDEGMKSRSNLLIENGILKGFLVDRLNGLRMGMEATGSSRRESYRYAPTSRMTNTYICAGTEKPADIIADTECALYAKKMGGGSVSPATGDFNFAVLEGYLIRNGKIAEPVRGATLIGKGAEILMQIDRVADNMEQAQGMCGSSSGSVPTNVGQPLIRVKEMTVGGRDSE